MEYDVVALGELLIDFACCGTSDRGSPMFEANPGGAPGNVLAMLAKLDRRTAFIGKVGADLFGQLLIDTLAHCGISTDGVQTDARASTTLAFVRNAPDGDRTFSFFRKPGADTLLSPDEVPPQMIENCRIFHFGSLSLTDSPAREATRHAAALARRSGALISFDPNLRPLLWDDLSNAKRQIEWGCSIADVVKIADDELRFLTGTDDCGAGMRMLRARYPQIRLLLLTEGRDGSDGCWGDLHTHCDAFLSDDTVDTTGAGDTFLGCCLARILDGGLDCPTQERLEEMLTFANAAASLITTRKGALCSMPEQAEIQALLRR